MTDGEETKEKTETDHHRMNVIRSSVRQRGKRFTTCRNLTQVQTVVSVNELITKSPPLTGASINRLARNQTYRLINI